MRGSHDDFRPAAAGFVLGDDDLLVDPRLEDVDVRDYADEPVETMLFQVAPV